MSSCTALYDCVSQRTDMLGFSKGDVMNVVEVKDANWLLCEIGGKRGIVAQNYVRMNTPASTPVTATVQKPAPAPAPTSSDLAGAGAPRAAEGRVARMKREMEEKKTQETVVAPTVGAPTVGAPTLVAPSRRAAQRPSRSRPRAPWRG